MKLHHSNKLATSKNWGIPYLDSGYNVKSFASAAFLDHTDGKNRVFKQIASMYNRPRKQVAQIQFLQNCQLWKRNIYMYK